MKTIAAGEFKAKCLAIMDEVQSKRTKFVITKNGKPVAQMIPVEEAEDSLFGFYAGKLAITDDIGAWVVLVIAQIRDLAEHLYLPPNTLSIPWTELSERPRLLVAFPW